MEEQAGVKALLRQDSRELEREQRRAGEVGGWQGRGQRDQVVRGLVGLGTGTSGGV